MAGSSTGYCDRPAREGVEYSSTRSPPRIGGTATAAVAPLRDFRFGFLMACDGGVTREATGGFLAGVGEALSREWLLITLTDIDRVMTGVTALERLFLPLRAISARESSFG